MNEFVFGFFAGGITTTGLIFLFIAYLKHISYGVFGRDPLRGRVK